MKQFAVIGLGRFGSSVARTLAQMGHEVLAIDTSEERVDAISQEVTRAVQLDAMDEDSLQAVGIRNFDTVVVAIGENIQASILVALILKELGVKHVVVKASNELHGKVLEKIGVDKVIYPERDMGTRLARYLGSKHLVDYLDLSPDYSIVEVEVDERMAGKTLAQLDLRARKGLSVVAIRRGANIIMGPGGDDAVQRGDILVVIGGKRDLEKLESGR
ncbi:MAG: TrkA family potassium uptake protein [Clostridia bacterium]|nr:TrkA family potassium uptake protein [Clostridia bacterium]